MPFKDSMRKFFFPPPGSPRWKIIPPMIVLLVVIALALAGGTYGWEYSNSPQFCGATCHTMPPQNAAYIESPHANVTCEECHIGRASFVNQLARKSQGLKELYYQTFNLYELPIRAKALRPAVDTCEKCHRPETFSDDSLRTIYHFGDGLGNPATSTYLVMKTGGGTKREGLGFGIHWHIENPVYYFATDELNQEIPYVRVMNEDGTTTEYVDVESDFDKSTLDESLLKPMDCITCHNRVTHDFQPPSVSIDESLARGRISASIPGIRQRANDALGVSYETRAEAMKAIEAVEEHYKNTDYYPGHGEEIRAAIEEMKAIYDRTVFPEHEIDWKTHPNNLGHVNTAGCFRCHDGKHLNELDQAVRLECNLCHSIPVVAEEQDFTATIEISRGPEPETHLNANWISMHHLAFDSTCANCHSVEDAGGTSNASFCSNSACHGSVYTFAGFDAPTLREILKPQIPTPAPAPALPAIPSNPTFANYFGLLLKAKCGDCHGDNPSAGFSATTYASLMQGGESGAALLPGDGANSLIVQIQSEKHFANFSPEELAVLIEWINAGAPEE